ncbi:DNA-directed RNA polymerase I subunit rpa49 [Punica granatum]|uniref:DNA-directed RNA polymerase I subunit rpa49 n=2 Tax=Punica granatum TaxID=22663 RepID=A0A6P8DW02_PUNGR|nr:DNA-directed RNA polymerase I subunit rpa49 [Punica granatum]PKI39886.1 hypothetical protein CRG98_039726 [Punica granatum]
METEPRLDGADTAARSKKRKKDKLSASIEVLHDHPDKSAPLVGYFPSGFDPIGDGAGLPPGVTVCRNKTKPNRLNLVVSPPGSTVDFVGSSFEGESVAVQPCTYALGVLDKETGSLRVVPIASNKILRLEPKVRSNVVEDERSELKGELSAKERMDKVRELTNLYGTKKSITQAKKLQSLQQEDDPNSQNDLDKKIKEVEINKEALESSGAEIARNIPPYNLAATDPKEAYPVEKIILGGEWDHITDILELVKWEKKLSPDDYPEFVRNRVHKLEETKDEFEKNTLGGILSYITHLVKFRDRFSADGIKSAKKHTFPSILFQRFSALFTVPESKLMPAEKINLLISYILVLCLFVDDFKTDPTDIAKDLRMKPVTLRPLFENLGCKLSVQKMTVYAKLPVPLKFPELRRRRRR